MRWVNFFVGKIKTTVGHSPDGGRAIDHDPVTHRQESLAGSDNSLRLTKAKDRRGMYNVAALRAALGFILPTLLFFSKAEGKGKARIGKEREEKRGRRKRSVAKGSREGSGGRRGKIQ